MSGVVAILGAAVLLALILRLGTAALVVTGLSRDVARFQVRSAFFGVGFTTVEAEQVVNHPVRRRIMQWLMLLGAIGITGLIGSAVLTLAQNEGSLVGPLVGLGIGLLALWALTAWDTLDRLLTTWFERALRRFTTLDTHDYSALLRLADDYEIRTFTVRPGGPLDGHALTEARGVEGVVLLGIERTDGTYVGAPSPETVVAAGDQITVYGRDATLQALAMVPPV